MTFLLTRRCARGPADGRWSLVPSAPLAQGARVLAVRQSDAVQNTSPTSSLTVLVDTSAPAAVRVDAPADGAAVPTAAPVVTGAGEPGARVEVSVDGAEARQVLVDASGRWTLTTAAPLTDGSHVLIVRQVDPAGNVSPTTSHSFTVDTVAPDAPVVTTPRDGATLDATRPAVAGTSEAGATLTLTVDGASAGTTVVTAGGTWSLTPAAALVDGARTLGATQTDRAGHTSAAASVRITVVSNPDPDGDGLGNLDEARLGTDPRRADTDGDGLSDGDEVLRHRTDPLRADTDADRLRDGQEVRVHRTDPLRADTDGDGIGDGHEVIVTGTRPTYADSDNDGLSDRVELVGVRMGETVVPRGGRAYVLGTVRTDPLTKDTDGDGLRDRDEIVGHDTRQGVRTTSGWYALGVVRSDPNHPDTDRDGLTDAEEFTGRRNGRHGRRPSDPAHHDTDRGGQIDGDEVRAGFDPTDVRSGPRGRG